jgi:hypothetical protein
VNNITQIYEGNIYAHICGPLLISVTVLLRSPLFGRWVPPYNFPVVMIAARLAPLITVLLRLLVGCYGARGVGLGFELENLFRAYTGLARARDVRLREEVSGPNSFGIINSI